MTRSSRTQPRHTLVDNEITVTTVVIKSTVHDQSVDVLDGPALKTDTIFQMFDHSRESDEWFAVATTPALQVLWRVRREVLREFQQSVNAYLLQTYLAKIIGTSEVAFTLPRIGMRMNFC